MAGLTYIMQPSGSVHLCRSSMVYVGYDDDNDPTIVPKPNLPYGLQVFVWRGALGAIPAGADEYQLKAYPDENGYGTFNIYKIIQGYFVDMDYNLPNETTGNLTVSVQCNLVLEGSALEVLSSEITAQFGYTCYCTDINNPVPTDGLLTNLPDALPMPTTGEGFMSLFCTNINGSTVEGYRIQADGGLTDSIFFTEPNPPVNTNQTMLRFGVGWEELNPTIQNDTTDFYTVTLIDGSSVPVGRTITYYIQDQCKYTIHKIDYVNAFGAWDRIFCYGNSQESLGITKQSGMRYVAPTFTGSGFAATPNDEWKQGVGQYINMNKQGDQMLTVNTGWVSEDFNEAFKQMFMSERIVLDGVAAILEDSTFTSQRKLTEKMINYTFKLKVAFTYANTVA